MEFSWMRTRSARSLTRAAVKRAGSQGRLLLSLGVEFKLGLYCWYTGTTTVPGFPTWPWMWLWFDFSACLQICLFTAVLLVEHWIVSDLIPVSGPGPNPDLLLGIPAPCWCSHCSFLPCYHAQLPVYLLTLSHQTTLTSLGHFVLCSQSSRYVHPFVKQLYIMKASWENL